MHDTGMRLAVVVLVVALSGCGLCARRLALNVTVTDALGVVVSGAQVTGTCVDRDGKTTMHAAATDASGVAQLGRYGSTPHACTEEAEKTSSYFRSCAVRVASPSGSADVLLEGAALDVEGPRDPSATQLPVAVVVRP